jgi:cytochrome b561
MAGDAAQPADGPAPSRRWSAPVIALHWLSAALILFLLGLGWYMVHGDISVGAKFDLYQLHKSLGFLSVVLLALRLCARLASVSPPLPPAMPFWERRLAGLAHVAFYLLLLAAALSGWFVVSAAIIAIPTRVFDLFVVPNIVVPNIVGPDMALEARMTLIHYWVSRLLIGLVVLHVAAALKHHFLDRDDILTRMLGLRRGRR